MKKSQSGPASNSLDNELKADPKPRRRLTHRVAKVFICSPSPYAVVLGAFSMDSTNYDREQGAGTSQESRRPRQTAAGQSRGASGLRDVRPVRQPTAGHGHGARRTAGRAGLGPSTDMNKSATTAGRDNAPAKQTFGIRTNAQRADRPAAFFARGRGLIARSQIRIDASLVEGQIAGSASCLRAHAIM